MTRINSTEIDLTINVLGYECGHTATVRYIDMPAERGSRERGGLQLEPDYPAGVEILTVIVKDRDISTLLTQRQIEAIAGEILEEV